MLIAVVLFLSPYTLVDIPQAVPSADVEKLRNAGVTTTDDLLAKGASAKDRHELAKTSKVSEKQLRTYVDMADLLRIRGVGPEMVKLFDAAKVHTSKELSQQDAKKLYDRIIAVNDKQKITQNPPDPASVSAWIDAAKQLPQVVK